MRRHLAVAFAALAIASIPRAAAATECELPEGWDSVAESGAHFVVFGEMHGTAQSPRFVGETICALAAKGERVLLGIEMEATADAALQEIWRDSDEGFAERLVRDMPGWAGRNDGVASRDMLAMLARLHTLRSNGAQIDVVAFNGFRDATQRKHFEDLPGQGPHEAAQADNILTASKARSYVHVILLVGSMHARGAPVQFQGKTYRPMRTYLDPNDTISLRMTYAGGEAWNCQITGQPEPGTSISSNDIDCSAHPAGDPWGLSGASRIVIGDLPPSDFAFGDAYDGYYFVKAITASPPAAADAAKEAE